MESMNVKLKKIITDLINPSYKEIEIVESTNLISDLGFDSLSIVHLIIEIEDSFNIEMEFYDMEEISEYGTLTKLVENNMIKGK